jgi:hypothetical protein
LRFANPSPPSSWIRDLHPRVGKHAWQTRARPAGSHQRALCGSRRVAEPDQMEAAARTRNGYRNATTRSWRILTTNGSTATVLT